MVAATTVTVAAVDDIPANNLQVVLGSIYGKAQYAANEVGAATYKADQANSRLDSAEGTIQYAADGVGTLDYHLRQIADLVGYTMPAAVAREAAPVAESE